MRDGKKEFLALLCHFYIVALLAALPLYTGQGYWQLGDTKYLLFRNVSFLCLGGWVFAGMLGHIRSLMPFCAVDWAVAAYGGCVLLSAAVSPYGRLAWVGYDGWYMGAISQLLFVGIYFFVSRQYDGAGWPVCLGEAALFLVTAFGLLHRLGIDPLGLMARWDNRDWEYSHMLSTLGNINWLCGYYSVALAFVAGHYLCEERRWLQAVLYLEAVAAFVLLGIQGSQGGLLILAVCVAMGILLERGNAAALRKLCLLAAGFCASVPLMGQCMKLRGDRAAWVADGNIFEWVSWQAWLAGTVACLVLFWLLGRYGKRIAGRAARVRPAVFLAGIAAILAASMAVYCNAGDAFGSGRGFLWRIALESFGQADGKEILLGAGPDCYAEAVYNRLGAGTKVWEGEHWDGAVFTNAHSELLSQLCNVGILGTASYLAIFLAGLCRYWGGLDGKGVGALALAMYGFHALISFQQVLNAPLLFLALGLCEAKRRRDAVYEMDKIESKNNH